MGKILCSTCDAPMQALYRAARQTVRSGPTLGRGPDGTAKVRAMRR